MAHKISIGTRIMVSSNPWKGKTGTVLDMHPINGYKVMIDTQLPIITNSIYWFTLKDIRRLTFLESVIDWIKN